MRVLMGLTYFRPYVSGLTIYVDRLASALTERGHTVTVLTSRYDSSLPARETMNGVEIVRAPVAARISKGVVMPRLGWTMEVGTVVEEPLGDEVDCAVEQRVSPGPGNGLAHEALVADPGVPVVVVTSAAGAFRQGRRGSFAVAVVGSRKPLL